MNVLNLKKNWKDFRKKRKENRDYKKLDNLKGQIESALMADCGDVPCFIVCYNNGVYVDSIVGQLYGFGIKPIVIDNKSTDQETIDILNALKTSGKAEVVYSPDNFGHMVGFLSPIYDIMPDVFSYTDPDLLFNYKLPHDFVNVLSNLTLEFNVFKAGFALDLLFGEKTIDAIVVKSANRPIKYEQSFSVREWESFFWRKKIIHSSLEIYSADIDTTFAVYRKSNYRGLFYDAVRVAGDYSAIHLPWFPERDLFNQENRENYLKGNKSTNWYQAS